MCPSKAGLVNAEGKKIWEENVSNVHSGKLQGRGSLNSMGGRVEPHTQNVSGPIGKTIPLGDARLSQLDPGAQDY